MQRAIFLTLTIVLCHCATSLYSQMNDLVKDDLKGKVMSVRETVFSVPKDSQGASSKKITSDVIHYYNDIGNRTKSSYYKQETLFSYRIYSYNYDDELITINEYNPDGNNYLLVSIVCDDNGYITDEYYDRKMQKSFDVDRKSIDVEYDTYYQLLFTKIKFQNDFKGYVTEAKYLTADDKLAFKFLHKYDYKYHRLETKYYNNSGKLSWRKTMKYDSDGHLKSKKYYESNRIAITSEYKHDTDRNGNWINRVESNTLHDNFFADGLNDNTIITVRKIEYY